MKNIPKEYRVLCAKTRRDKKSEWLPLWMHSTDTAGVMEYLSRNWVARSTRKALGFSCEEDLVRYGKFLGFVHDIGKGTAVFQHRITSWNTETERKLYEEGWKIKKGKLRENASRHALAGEQILLSLGVPDSMTMIIGSHHGKPTSLVDQGDMNAYPCNYRSAKEDSAQWTGFWKYWINYSLSCSGYKNISDIPEVNKAAQTILSGLLIMADWLASNTSYFPLIDIDDDPGDDVYPLRIEKGIRRFNFPQKTKWKTVIQSKIDFCSRFGFPPNAMQAAVIETACACRSPGILIIEAQMGSGKTEAALAAVEILAKKSGADGIFYGLPTQATADGIFPRLLRWGRDVSKNSTHTIRLVHGAADLNEDYMSLRKPVDKEAVSGDEDDSSLIAHEWFSGRKQALLADYVVGTVDQALMAGLKQKHVMLRHLGISGKVVVIDECHAYDTYTNEYLKETLKWLGAYGVPVVLLSATLPAAKRKELVFSYLSSKMEKSSNIVLSDNNSYPLLTWSDGSEAFQKTVPEEDTCRLLKVKVCWDNDNDLVKNIRNDLKDGGVAGVIVNTVKRAQEIYKALAAVEEDTVMILCHAQMVIPDRLEKERNLAAHTGKNSGEKDRERVIVVGTSVLEQSLDIDFDVLYTDLCPVDLLLQRIGRLHRHAHHDPLRPEMLKKPVCHILCGTGQELEKGACSIYGEYLLMRTKAIVPDEIAIPHSIPELVQPVYNDKNDLGLTGEKYEKAKSGFFVEGSDKRRKAGLYKFKAPANVKRYSPYDTLRGSMDGTVESIGIKAEAAVRDGDDPVEVLVLVKDREECIHFLPWQNEGAPVPNYCVPSEEECLKIVKQRLRLPHKFCHGGVINQTLTELDRVYRKYFPAWKESAWLRSELVLLLNSDLETDLCGLHIKYTKDEGLLLASDKGA